MITITLNTFAGREIYTGAAALGVLDPLPPPPLGGLCDQVKALSHAATVCSPLAPTGRAAWTSSAEERLAARIDAIVSLLPEASAVGGGLTKAAIASALGWNHWPVEQALTAAVRDGRILRRRGCGAHDVTYTRPKGAK